MRHQRSRHLLLPALSLALLAPLAAPAAAQRSEPPSEAYGYIRTVEGRGLLSSREPEETRDVEANLPILSGDAVQVEGGSRVEAVLADGSVARLEAGTELVFDQLARSPDSPAGAVTRLVMLAGEMQIRVPDEAAEPEPIEIESNNTRIYLIRGGIYWLGIGGGDETVLVVRDGSAEVLTNEGSLLVQSGEEVRISGTYQVRTEVALAGRERGIELWARDLENAARVAHRGTVDERLHYAAAPLERAGTWVSVEGRTAWRPRVRYGWRPFTDGHWVHTPSGLTWVAQERWGWVTAHYGTWDYLPSYGWCWFPGRTYSPAWVYWYWGPSHAAWVPYGYYARHYGWRAGSRGFGLRFGVYGWASGGWSVFADWTFCPLGYFGRRGGRYYHRSGADLARDRRALAVPRGIITTDTRRLDRAVWTRPYEVRQRLAEVHRGRFVDGRSPGRDDLPDVTTFVARRRDLAPEVRQIVRTTSSAEERPVLRQTTRRLGESGEREPSRVTIRTKPGGDLSAGDSISRRDTALRPGERAPRVGTRTITPPVTRSTDSTSRFERPSVRRPTQFERAPTSIYSRRDTAGSAPVVRGSERPSSSSSGSRSTRFERAPTSVYSPRENPGATPGSPRAPVVRRQDSSSSLSGGSRPTHFERAPTSVYRREAESERAPATRTDSATPSRYQGVTRIYERDRSPATERPATSGVSRPGSERPPVTSRSEGISSSGRRVESSSPPSRTSTRSSTPSRAPARRVVESSRSHSSRSSASSGSRSSGPRVQSRSSSARSSSSSKASASSSSRSRAARKKDD